MKSLIWISGLSGITLLLASCANNQSADPADPGWGPFDSAGNYREDWADDPSKWQRPGSRRPAASAPVIARTDQPPAHSTPLPAAAPKPPPRPTATAAARPTPRPTATAVTRPKPKPKPAPKPPAPTRYTVKQGDTLWAIANRNGTSVAALQRANSISGSLIKPGQRLVIPKR